MVLRLPLVKLNGLNNKSKEFHYDSKYNYQSPALCMAFIGLLSDNRFKGTKIPYSLYQTPVYLPAHIFCVGPLYTICTRSNIYHLLILLGGLIIGIAAGFRIVRPLPIRFDKAHGLVELPGSWLTLILVVSIFSLQIFPRSYPSELS